MARINISLPQFSENQVEGFWSRVDKTPGQGPAGECWEWAGPKWRKYGRVCYSVQGNLRSFRAHRIAFYLSTGEVPSLLICHHCDNPPCCNPQHLFEGTQSDNMRDAKRKGRIHVLPPRPKGRAPRQMRLKLGKGLHRVRRWKRYALTSFVPNPTPRTWGVGERHARAKLTKDLVMQIRAEYADGASGPILATKYGVHRASIRDIVLRRSWNHI